MEDGKKKKKNKKNKGKPSKTVDNITAGLGESTQTEPEVHHESAPEQNNQESDTSTVVIQHGGKPIRTVDNVALSSEEPMQTGSEGNHGHTPEHNHQELDTGNVPVGTQHVSLMDSERERERQKVKESNLVDLQETIKVLQSNMLSCIEKEASLEKKIELLQNENELFANKEINWSMKFENLQSELHSFSVKEASLENKLNSMVNENDSRIWKENLISDMAARLEEANKGLLMQVKELERSRESLILENQQLTNSISLLEARVQNLESEAASFRLSTRMMPEHISEDNDSEKQVEPVSEASEKLVTVEPELVRKMYQQNGIVEHSSMFSVSSLETDAGAVPPTYLSPSEEINSESTDQFASSGTFFETISITDANVNDISDDGVRHKELPLLHGLSGSAEIVQIPLDDNEIQHAEAQDTKNDENVVPFSDAPLIGAPFRLMSFVAKYVSGADLVKENRHYSGR